MKLSRLLSILILLSVLLGGCSTFVQVRQVPTGQDSTEAKKHPCNGWTKQGWVPGIRYSLPATFLVVKPDPKNRGGYSVETRLFPDHDQTYAIDACTFLASYTFNVDLDEGMLDKVMLTQSSAEVTEAVVNAASEIAKAELDERKEEKKKAEQEAEEAKQKLKTLQDAVAAATKNLEVARADVAEWERLIQQLQGQGKPIPDPFQAGLRTARVTLRGAEIDLQRANQALEEFQAGEGSSGGSESSASGDTLPVADSPDGAPPGEAAGTDVEPMEAEAEAGASALPNGQNSPKPVAPPPAPAPPAKPAAEKNDQHVKGPVFYRLADTCDPWASDEKLAKCHVKLVAVTWKAEGGGQEIQLPFPVTSVPKSPGPRKKAPQLADQQISPAQVSFGKEGVYERNLVLTKPICEVVAGASSLKTRPEDTDGVGDPEPGDELPDDAPLGDENFFESVELNLLAGKGTIQLRILEGKLEPNTKYRLDLSLRWDQCDTKEPVDEQLTFNFDIGS